MEFGSKYVYNYSDSEEETVSDDEFETGMEETCSAPATVVEKMLTPAVVSDALPDAVPEVSIALADAACVSPPPPPCARAVITPQAARVVASSSRAVSAGSVPKPKQRLRTWMMSKPASSSSSSSQAQSAQRDNGSERDRHERGGNVPPAAPVSSAGGKRWRRADTNIVAVKFDQLTKPSNMHTGDAVSCKQCHAMLSHISKLSDQADDKVWRCEFCGECNLVDLLPDEMPTQSDVTYMIKPAALTTMSSCLGVEESLVVFCIDTSGSMCVSQEVQGRLNLRASHADRFRSLNDTGENQWMPGQNRNVTYITRLQALQAAVDHQLDQLAKEHPSRKVVLINFSSEVIIVGDGTMTPVTLAGDKLCNFDEIVQTATSIDVQMRIQASRTTLGQKVFDLEEGGQTALGPAMLVAITMASKVGGSKVVMCTDGLANIGLGNLDNVSTDQYRESSEFYSKLGDIAKDKGVTVSILTIAGTECKLVELGSVASATGGQVNTVDPLKLTQEFGNILANPVIASRVVATFIVHKGLYIRNEPELTSSVKREVGNVTKDTEITFEYGVRRHPRKHNKESDTKPADDKSEIKPAATSEAEEKQKTEKMDTAEGGDSANVEAGENETTKGGAAGGAAGGGAEAAAGGAQAAAVGAQAAAGGAEAAATSRAAELLNELPFQVQIQYTDIDGAEALRVLTQLQPVTKDRQQAEININAPVVGCHATHQSSVMALEGHYTPSRLNAFMYQRLLYRNVDDEAEYGAYLSNVSPMEMHVRSAQRVEARSRGRTMADYEDSVGSEESSRAAESQGIGSRLSNFLFGGKKSERAPAPRSVPAASAPSADFGRTMRRRQCSDSMSNVLYKGHQVSSKSFTPSAPSILLEPSTSGRSEHLRPVPAIPVRTTEPTADPALPRVEENMDQTTEPAGAAAAANVAQTESHEEPEKPKDDPSAV